MPNQRLLGQLSTLLALVASLAGQPTYAAPQLRIDAQNLLGVDDIVVNGTVYNVSFIDGLCSNYYPGCTSSEFNGFEEIAAIALRDALNSAFLALHEPITHLNGCDISLSDPCVLITPTASLPNGYNEMAVYVIPAGNPAYAYFAGGSPFNSHGNPDPDTSDQFDAGAAIALWTPVRFIPEPSTLLLILFAISLVCLTTLRRPDDASTLTSRQ